jgi:elongation factor P hydroxylase
MNPYQGKLAEVAGIFRGVFRDQGVRLSGGNAEPFYRASGPDGNAEIAFTHDYLNSCLHEIAHWCIAGKDRRLRDDYGYWYRPDGRNAGEQREFFMAEAAPQALEWTFAMACGEPFRMSCDNLAGEVSGEAEFAAALEAKLRGYLADGFPRRAWSFVNGLMERYHPEVPASDRLSWLASRAAAPGPHSSRIDSQ